MGLFGTAGRRSTGRQLLLGTLLSAIGAAVMVQAQIPGRNVNMVAGHTWPDGDPYLQRQNEPSLAASTRNPLHLLAGSNDYRSVDLPGLPDGGETGDAWLGLYKSFDGGQRWKSTLLPGYPQDASAVGKASPLHRYQAAADPVVRPGPSGLFYYSGIVFDRMADGKSRVFVSRFIDNNDKEAGDPIHYLGATAVASDSGKTGFIDKPWIAVDVPRSGAAMCTIRTPGEKGQITQRIPAGNVYIAYTHLVGTGAALTATIMFSQSSDCGVTFSAPIAISQPTHKVNQGATIAIDPATGAIYVAWRKFGVWSGPDDAKVKIEPDAIVVTRAQAGAKKFEKPSVLREFYAGRDLGQLIRFLVGNRRVAKGNAAPPTTDPATVVSPDVQVFDQETLEDRFRTNAYPTMAIDGTGRVYIAWSERGFQTSYDNAPQDASIVMTTGGIGEWRIPFAVEMHDNPGHQFMPSLAFAGGKLMLVYYDLRKDVSGVFRTFVDEDSAIAVARKRHTIDLRATQADPAALPVFAPSVRVSEYLEGSRPGSRVIEPLQYNPPNLPIFQLGTVPFMGDYVDIAAAPAMVQDASGIWRHNTDASTAPVFHTAWTDNRDVRPPPVGRTWADYTPPSGTRINSVFDPTQTVAPCSPGSAGMRNQNVYTSRLTAGLLAGSPGNTKPLDPIVPRAFVVFAQNTTSEMKLFRMTVTAQPVGGWASFSQFEAGGPVTAVDVAVPPRSTVSKSVFATSSDPHAKIAVDVAEIDAIGKPEVTDGGLASSVVLNPDISNPDISNPDISNPDISNPDISNPDISNPDISNTEVYNPDISNPDISNPDISNPDISNPDISNPDISNVLVLNPDISNPDISNPDISNPDISNPDISNPDISNPDISNGSLTDVTWTVTNTGNTTSNYDVDVLNGVTVPQEIKTQLIVHKTYTTPVSDGCTLKYQTQTVLVASIVNPHLDTTGALADLSLWLEPGANGKITLRVVDPDPGDQITFNPLSADTPVAPTVESTAVNTADLDDPVPTPPSSTPPLVTSTTLEVISQPSNAVVSTSLGNVQVRLMRTVDGASSPVSNASVAAGILTNPGGGQLAGESTVATDINGYANFSTLAIDRAGQGYQLAFTAAAAGAVPVPSASFTVTASADPTRNVFTVTTTADSGTGSLRQAIIDANAIPNGTGGPDIITFDFRAAGVYTISLASMLPAVTQPVIIDGATQLGYSSATGQPLIHVAGNGANEFQGLVFESGAANSLVRGLSLTGFGTASSQDTTAAIRISAASVGVYANWLGIAPDGSPSGNKVGVWITGGSAFIGGTDGAATRNVISASQQGIYVSSSTGTTIRGNYIGTSPGGQTAHPNTDLGINLQPGAINTVIGGPVLAGDYFAPTSPANLISGNLGGGIGLQDAGAGGPTGTQILGNVIGLAANGTDLGNSGAGVSIHSASGTIVGAPGAGNVISGNGVLSPFAWGPGVNVNTGPSGPPAVIPVIRSNFIGVDPTGALARRNIYEGVVLWAAARVGGTGAGEGNLIAGNGFADTASGTGILIFENAGGSLVEGNILGLSASGQALGNGYSGITVHGTTAGALIGGSVPGARNVISGNAHAGVAIYTTNASLPQNVVVKGNYIGTDATGAVAGVGNGVFGISVSEGTGHVFGGDTAADGNLIAGNGGPGVGVLGPDTQAAILSNRIFQNAGLGIDLGADGLTANDNGDVDNGPNGLLNHPNLLSATRNATAGNTVIPVSFTGAPGVSYRLQFFTNAACDGTHGEGALLFHEENIMPTSGDATAVINAPLVPEGTVLTATLTAFSGGTGVTSEFSNCVTAVDDPGVLFVTSTADSGSGSLRAAIQLANSTPNQAVPDVIAFAIAGPGVKTIALTSQLPAITETVIIDGATQPGYTAAEPLIHVAGTGANQFQGLVFEAGAPNSIVRGLSLTGFGTSSSQDTTAAILISAASVTVEGNWLGVGPNATALGNKVGIWLTGGSAIVGGTGGQATRNVISASQQAIYISSSNGTTILGNYIGTSPDGLTAMPNTDLGINLQAGAANTVIGGQLTGGGFFGPTSPSNLISGNVTGGIGLQGSGGGGPTGTQIHGNVIGLSRNGSALGNGSYGISIGGTSGVAIGAPNGFGNVISGNGRGIQIQAGALQSSNISIKGNMVGTNLAGATGGVGNAAWGIVAEGTGIVIGGDGGGDDNVIAGNGFGPGVGGGVAVVGATSTVALWSNDIFDNDGLGIDLGADGVTADDGVGDGDSGPNEFLNTPVIGGAVNAFNGESYFRIRLETAPGTYRVQFFRSTGCDPSGRGEGQAHLLSTSTLTVGPSGVLEDFRALSAPPPLTPGDILTATVSRVAPAPAPDVPVVTSEFSACATVTAWEPPVSVGPVGGGGGSAFAITCGLDFAATALRGRAGDDIDRTELWCAPKTSLATPATFFGAVGGFGGTDYGSQLTCPSGSAMTGIHGRAGQVLWPGYVVDTLGVVCTNPVTSTVVSSAAAGTAAPLAVPFTLSCPAGKQVIGIFGGQGGLLDRIGIVCQ
jgi:hypothetical protein